MDLVPEFPTDAPVVLLTAQASSDPKIIDKIEARLRDGGKVVVTSGFVRKLQDKGLGRIAEIEHAGRVAAVKDYTVGWSAAHGDRPILIPQITYRTNDSWELVSATAGGNGWPLLHDADYGKGHLYVLTIPENFADFAEFPAPVLNAIRTHLTPHLPVRLEAPGQVSLFVYDNGTCIVESFRDEPVDVALSFGLDHAALEDLGTGETLAGAVQSVTRRWDQPPVADHRRAGFKLPPHSFRAFRLK
jgi:hypothetical protein